MRQPWTHRMKEEPMFIIPKRQEAWNLADNLIVPTRTFRLAFIYFGSLETGLV